MVVQVPRERHLQMTFLVLLILLCFVLILILASSPDYFKIKSVPVFNQLRSQNISSMRSGEQGNKITKMYVIWTRGVQSGAKTYYYIADFLGFFCCHTFWTFGREIQWVDLTKCLLN